MAHCTPSAPFESLACNADTQRPTLSHRIAAACDVADFGGRGDQPFALPVKVDKVEGAILSGQIQKLGLGGPPGTISFQSRGNAAPESAAMHRRAAWNSLT
jgi:hypothetical protein